jgi:hypothetical protein
LKGPKNREGAGEAREAAIEMDATAREVIITILERLRYMEKTRHDDMASLKALTSVLVLGNPEFLERYLDDVYDGLIGLLKNPGPVAEDEQEKLRRLLESFEGPKQ